MRPSSAIFEPFIVGYNTPAVRILDNKDSGTQKILFTRNFVDFGLQSNKFFVPAQNL